MAFCFIFWLNCSLDKESKLVLKISLSLCAGSSGNATLPCCRSAWRSLWRHLHCVDQDITEHRTVEFQCLYDCDLPVSSSSAGPCQAQCCNTSWSSIFPAVFCEFRMALALDLQCFPDVYRTISACVLRIGQLLPTIITCFQTHSLTCLWLQSCSQLCFLFPESSIMFCLLFYALVNMLEIPKNALLQFKVTAKKMVINLQHFKSITVYNYLIFIFFIKDLTLPQMSEYCQGEIFLKLQKGSKQMG